MKKTKELQQIERLVFDDFLQSYVPETATYKELSLYDSGAKEVQNYQSNNDLSLYENGAKVVQNYQDTPTATPKFEPYDNIGETAKATTHPIFFVLIAGFGVFVLGVWGLVCACIVLCVGVLSGLANVQEARNKELSKVDLSDATPKAPTKSEASKNSNIVVNNYITVNQ